MANQTWQVATAFGEYTGGALRVFGEDGIMDVDTKNRFVRFDGRCEHVYVLHVSARPTYPTEQHHGHAQK